MKWILLFAVAGLPAVAAGQVYKCKGASGETVYTSEPCTPSAEPMRLRSTRASTLTAGELSNRQAVFRSTDLQDARTGEQQCVASAGEAISRPGNERIAALEGQIRQLNAQAAMARNNLAGATLYAGIQTQISGLQGSISSERGRMAEQLGAARDRCAAARQQREEQIEKAYADERPAG